MGSRFLLGIAIGPVQEFIQAGRKTRDLWYGSKVLSDLAHSIAREVAGHGDLIFPEPQALDASQSVPNKILVLLRENEQEPETLAAHLRDQARKHLRATWTTHVWSRFGSKRAIDQQLAEEQLANFLEFYAAWHPVPDPDRDYRNARRQVDRLISARKTLRDFDQPHHPASRRKSALDPLRESVIRTDVSHAQSMLHLKPGEHLDAVSLIKRLADLRTATDNNPAGPKPRFASTSRIAIDPFTYRVGHDALAPLRNIAAKAGHSIGAEEFDPTGTTPILQHYAGFPFDCQLFWDPAIESKEGTDDAKASAKEFFRLANNIRRDIHHISRDIPEMPAYYAIVAADGDNMGRFIDSIPHWTDHQILSAHLSGFTATVEGLTASHAGALVYSGGDDVLAFLPVDQALPYARAISAAFDDCIGRVTDKVTREPGSGGKLVTSTLSVGIAIAHYSEHLNRALGWARDTEKYAKDGAPGEEFEGRNALAVAFYPRGSAEPSARAGHNWSDRLMDRWARWVAGHQHEILPDGLGYELRRLAAELDAVSLADEDKANLVNSELTRLLGKKRSGQGNTGMPVDLHEAIRVAAGSSPATLRRLASELIIAREVAMVADIAFGRPASSASPHIGFTSRKGTANA